MIKITNEDNMKLMARYEDNYFDLAIVDPPYGIGDFSNKPTNKKKHNKSYDISWNEEIPTIEYFKELQRVSKHHIIFGFQFYIKYLWDDLKGVIIHDFGSTGGFGSDSDLAITDLQNRVTSFKYRWQGFIRGGQKEIDKQRIHPCEKPQSLYEYLLKNYAKEGNKILDTHLGSGSIAIALDNVNKIEKMNLSLIACELDNKYYKDAVNRLKNHQQQLTIF